MQSLTSTLARVAVATIALVALAAPVALAASELPAGAPRSSSPPPISDRVIVEWQPHVSATERAAGRSDAGTTLVRSLGTTRFQLVKPQAGASVADTLAALRRDPSVRVAERDGYSTLTSIPNDPLFDQLWGLRNLGTGIGGFFGAVAGDDVDAPAAWDRTVGSPTTVVADLDTGYRYDDPDLGPVAWTNPGETANGSDDDGDGIVDDVHGADFVGSSSDSPTIDGDPTDDNIISGGHGLHTAGTIGADGNNGIGITGVAQNVRIMALRVCSNSPSDNDQVLCLFSSQIDAINYAGAHGARVANMSLGGKVGSTLLRDAFAENPQTLFVISAGNDAEDNDPGGTPHYPCAYDPSTSGIPGAIDNIICVAATDQADELAFFSDYGATSVDLGAPGTEILSTYPAMTTPFHDDFENAGSFATNWSATGTDGGFARTSNGPDGSDEGSFGMRATTGGAPAANQVVESTSAAIAIPAGTGSCSLTQTRDVATDANDSYQYFVLSNGSPVFTSSASISASGTFFTTPITGLAGTNVQVRFRFTTGASPAVNKGVWLDDVDFTCYAPLATPLTHAFLEGTSMAAPHVTGAAGLLFSLKPSASVADVKNALLGGVAPDPSLAGLTTTGGRLDVAHAMSLLVPPDTSIVSGPPSSTTSTSASFAFQRADAALPATFECSLDGAAFAACGSPAGYGSLGVGAHTFQVRARDGFGTPDPTPASASWTIAVAQPGSVATTTPLAPPHCVVPQLVGKTLAQAKRALAHAHCRLGKVTRPKARRGHKLPPLVVKRSSPRAGSRHAAGAKVAITLAPKRKHRKHR
jgi:hypothetical protein